MKVMEVHFTPDLQAKIDQLVIETGRAPDKLLEDAKTARRSAATSRRISTRGTSAAAFGGR